MKLFKRIRILVVLLLISIFSISSLLFTSPAEASILDDIFNKAKEVLLGKPEKESRGIEISSSINLAPGGDVDNNGEVDSGDFVRFEYVITNNDDKEYSWLNLETNINRREINTISNFKGITGIEDSKDKLIIPNIRLYPKQTVKISFDAKVSYSTKKDIDLFTEPKIKEKAGNILTEDNRRQIKAKKITKEKMNKALGNKQELEILSVE